MKQVLILLFLLMLHVSKAFACSPAGEADPWYLYDFKVDQNTLPEGVSVVSKPLSLSHRPWHADQAAYFMINSSGEPL
ncbi:MAG: hypothetical protein MK137_07665, partial [Rickettsiales bacterium]|nr:hypothetical protein [Rickettsiales bacterium]